MCKNNKREWESNVLWMSLFQLGVLQVLLHLLEHSGEVLGSALGGSDLHFCDQQRILTVL